MSVPVALLAVVVLGYGVMIPWLGFYGDDWIYIHNYNLLGPLSFMDFVAIDRPFSAWVYIIATPLFGDAVLPYHLLLLVLRWVSSVLVWKILCRLWAKKPVLCAGTALLFALYPGFQQEPIAVQFILHFAVLDLFLFSVLMMLDVAEGATHQRLRTILGVLAAGSIFSLEYFAGLELLRPVMLWFVLRGSENNKPGLWKRVLALWLPYILVLIAFATWRAFVFKFPTYRPVLLEGLALQPKETVALFTGRFFSAMKISLLGAWRQVLILPGDRQLLVPYLCIVILTFFTSWKVLGKPSGEEVIGDRLSDLISDSSLKAFRFGLLAVVFAGMPFWITFIRIELEFPWDRSLLPFMLGACLMVAAVADIVVQTRFRGILLAGLVALSGGFQFNNSQIYRLENERLRDYFWQLTWRAPDLQPGTIIVSDEIPLFRYSDNDITPILNWTYAPELKGDTEIYKYFDLATRESSPLPGFEEGLPINHSYRSHKFHGNTSQVLSVYYDLSHCLWILGPGDDLVPGIPHRVRETLPISHPEMIRTTTRPQVQPPDQLGSAPDQGWCYYFEKADLARQAGNWKEITQLGDFAWEHGFSPGNVYEYLPFLEGYIQTGERDQAVRLAGLIAENPQFRKSACARVNSIKANGQTASGPLIEDVRYEIGCEG